jgi:protease IV
MNLNRHFFDEFSKLIWKVRYRLLDECLEFTFADFERHRYNPQTYSSTFLPNKYGALMKRVAAFAIWMLFVSGCGIPSFLVTPVENSTKLEEQTVSDGEGFAPPKIVIIEVEGMLSNVRSGGFMQPSENSVSLFTQELDKAAKDPAVKAVVLRVNSPGGTVTASDIMYESVLRFKEKTHKPVVASLQDLAASGAFYVSCGADKIVAHPTSIVGSIGVIFNTFNIEGTLEKIGASTDAIKSGPLKDMGSPFKKLDPQARAVMQGMVDEYFKRFVGVVTSHRTIKSDMLATATDGRVFSGTRAVEVGLVDRTGLLNDAIDEAQKMAKTQDARVIIYRRPYGYGGSIYAQGAIQPPQANVMELKIPGLHDPLPSGFYYLWMP